MSAATPMFDRIALIGIGLIGSSLSHAARRAGLAKSIVGSDVSTETIATALKIGLIDEGYATPKEAAIGADLVILCTPVGLCGPIAKEIAPVLAPGAILSDVGSVKGSIVRDVAPYVPQGVHFVAAHPIAGTEQSGPEAGFAELFDGRWCILTPEANTDKAAVAKLREFWEALGSNVEIMTPEHHDLVLAITSHVPHLIAFNIVNTAAHLERVTDSEVIKFSAGGFRDFTRIAASDPTMWRDVFLNNKDAVLDMLGRFTEDLTMLQRAIRFADGDTLHRLFTDARTIRRSIIQAGQDTPAPDFGRSTKKPEAPMPTKPAAEGERDVWVFGYGSLMWNPGFPFREARHARLSGFHRAFCIYSVHYRGTLKRPGLVLGLDRGGSCEGLAFRLEPATAAEALAYLRARELIYGVYREALVPVRLLTGEAVEEPQDVLATTFIAERAHPAYTGPLSLRRQVELIRGAKGTGGTNLDYVLNTLAHLATLGIREPQLARIKALAGAFAERDAPRNGRRPRSLSLFRAFAHQPIERPAVVQDNRFGHRAKLAAGKP